MNFSIEALISVFFLAFSCASLLFITHRLNRLISLIIALLSTAIIIAKSVGDYEAIKALVLMILLYIVTITVITLKQDDDPQHRDNTPKITYICAIIIVAVSAISLTLLTQNITTLSTRSEEKKLQQQDDKFLNSFKNSSFGLALSEVGGSVSNSTSKQDIIITDDQGQFKMTHMQRGKLQSRLSDSFLVKNFSEFILLLSAFLSVSLIYRASNKSHS